MNQLTPINTPQTMSSRDIADLCDKRHDNVMADIRKMLNELGLHAPDFSGTFQTGKGNLYTCFHLPKRETLILVSGYNLTMRAAIIDRWQELEVQQESDPIKVLNDPTAMRGLLLTYSEKVIELETANAELLPQAQALERIALSDGSLCITDAAKTLQVRPKNLFSYLKEHHWIYTRGGGSSYIAYQDKLQSGLMEHKVTVITHGDGMEKSRTQVRVTPKGLARLGKVFPPAAEAA